MFGSSTRGTGDIVRFLDAIIMMGRASRGPIFSGSILGQSTKVFDSVEKII